MPRIFERYVSKVLLKIIGGQNIRRDEKLPTELQARMMPIYTAIVRNVCRDLKLLSIFYEESNQEGAGQMPIVHGGFAKSCMGGVVEDIVQSLPLLQESRLENKRRQRISGDDEYREVTLWSDVACEEVLVSERSRERKDDLDVKGALGKGKKVGVSITSRDSSQL
ncbi:uncharacterized protein LY89DRAFT_715647 [Mollisia scopiformis]|uniref:Uncharacterized protein n=1 Tax=Mollisia scopiformis TaxID=149040 RepID=A0A194XP20_MOLSC|nr:uncharacterized protein LY89DRAFT_715647 [Mollisia scopiformis]KUJ21482.1 hypothetical protein LY89DRAFT_715647 [Mollisia scopiformis]